MSAVQQNTPEWLELRKNMIGASDAPIIMGDSPWKTPFQLWEEKLSLKKPPEMNAAMQRGHELEPIARQAYIDYTGNYIEPKVVFSETHHWMMASLDGLSIDGNLIVEIKCPGKKDHEIAKKGEVPKKYWAQLQHQLATINSNILHYFSYLDGDVALVTVEADEKYIKQLMKKEVDFWNKMQSLEAPALSDRDYVEKRDDIWVEATQEWATVQLQLEDLKAREKKCRELLIQLSGGVNCIGNGVRVQKVVRKGSVDYKAIPELANVNLDKYRKAPVESWRLTAK